MYCVYEEEIMVEDEQSYYTYGIAAPESGERVGNICVVRSEVEALAEQMNRGGVEPIHMKDVVEDWLGER